MKHRSFATFVGLTFLACAAGTPPPEEKPVTAPPTIATGETPVAEPPSRDASGGGPFAASPLTELATALTRFASTVLDGNPPPRGPIPFEKLKRDRKLIETSSGTPPKSSELEFLVFGIEMDIMFDEGSDPNISAGSPGPPPPPDDGAVEATLLLGKTGVKIVELHVRSGKKTQALPGWLSGATPVGSDLFNAAKSGRLSSMLVGESERSMLGNDKLFEMAMKERPKPARLEEVEAAAKKYPRVIGIEVDELYLLAKSRSGGAIWIFEFNIDEDDGQIVLDSSPLFSVDRRDPDDRMGHPVESPGPPPPAPRP